MASGKTVEMINFARMMFWRKQEPREKRERDRSLRGKDRIRARRGEWDYDAPWPDQETPHQSPTE